MTCFFQLRADRWSTVAGWVGCAAGLLAGAGLTPGKAFLVSCIPNN